MSSQEYSPYPPGPAPGSNAIGEFTIGVSQIGSIPPYDWWQTVISQYANSPRLTTLIGNFFQYVDQTANLDQFYDLMWNVNTAQGYGLDCWGTIVAVNRVLHIGAGPKYLGWEEGGDLDYDPFNQSPWYSGEKLTENYILTDDGFRTLILAKAFSNICDGSIPSINRLLTLLFGQSGGQAYCTDGGNMTMTYTFNFVPNPVELSILTQSGVMPTPTGVSFSVVYPGS